MVLNSLRQTKVLNTLIAASLASQIALAGDIITSSCILPIINKKKTVDKMNINCGDFCIDFGKVVILLIRIAVVFLLLYAITYVTSMI